MIQANDVAFHLLTNQMMLDSENLRRLVVDGVLCQVNTTLAVRIYNYRRSILTSWKPLNPSSVITPRISTI